MIPIKLKLRNFMCYRDIPTLSFEGIHTACLSGDNGAGKSALIDAMTWALWGEARGKSDDDLIYLGQKEMEVEFDFAVGEQRYRVLRKRSRPKKAGAAGQTVLELQIASGDGFRPITGATTGQTQQKIIETLRMDYGTFINSAFLKQGRADEFTNQAPAKRKEVLANILSLDVYDELEEKAKERARQQELEVTQLQTALQDIAEELLQKPGYESEFARAQSELTALEQQLAEKEARLSALRQQNEALVKKKTELEQLETHLHEREKNLAFLDDQMRQLAERIKEYEALMARRPEIEAGYTRLIQARQLNEELSRKLGLLVKLGERKKALEKAVERAQAEVVKDHALAQREISNLESKAEKLPQLKEAFQQLQAQWRQLAGRDEGLGRKKQEYEESQTQVNYLESRQGQLQKAIAETDEKLRLLAAQTEAKCPLCEHDLGAEGLQLISSKYNAEKQQSMLALQTGQASLVQQKSTLAALKNEVARLEMELNQQKFGLQSKIGRLNKEIADAEDAGQPLSAEREKLAALEERLAKKDFARAEQAALGELERELAKLDYNESRHEKVKEQMAGLEQFDSRWHKLEEAGRRISQDRETLARHLANAQELHQYIDADSRKRQALSLDLGQLPETAAAMARAETERQELTSQRLSGQETVGRVKAKLQRCADLELKQAEKTAQLTQSAQEEEIYNELAQAFGKKGVQALLIERVLPEIEAEANRLLGRMTDNRMHIKIETQRETKKGDIAETLDINISDELGTRNYEMFSGGEAFRINFAVRIALSRLLARRAGAPLPTLIIDEGFGTQDNAGIEKLKEAINSIQDDFNKIIVITHIEELRDAFPSHIDVVKTAEGSTVSVS